MKVLVGLLILLITISFTGCKEPTNEEIYYEAQKHFINLDSYQCVANIKISNKELLSSYKAKHIYKKPDKYYIEMLGPEESSGCTTIYNGNQAWLYHPQINQSFFIKNFNDSIEESMFLGYFLKISLTGEYNEISSETINGQDYLAVTVEIPGNNTFRQSEKIWINKNGLIPYKLVIYDHKGNCTVEVTYADFKYNEKIADEKFALNIAHNH